MENQSKSSELSQMIHDYEMSIMDKQNDYAMQLRSNLALAQTIQVRLREICWTQFIG